MSYDLMIRALADELASASGETWATLDTDRQDWWMNLAGYVHTKVENARADAIAEVSL